VTAVQLADGVWRIPTAPADLINSFLLADDDGSLTLVDAGLKNAHKRVLQALDQLGRAPGDVQRILLTHAHADHAGGLAAVQGATGGRVLSHDDEATYLRSGTPPLPAGALGRLLSRAPGTGFRRVALVETFTDGDTLPVAGGLTVVHTPGHSPGHCSFLHPGSGVLITGDAVFNVRRLTYSPKTFCTDIPLSRESAGRLRDLEFSTVAFTHGPEVRSGARQALQAFLDRRPS
jgi:glyoxylase-like metal-dependent hydrolase (beta-lactamase superfamily II)